MHKQEFIETVREANVLMSALIRQENVLPLSEFRHYWIKYLDDLPLSEEIKSDEYAYAHCYTNYRFRELLRNYSNEPLFPIDKK